MSLDTRTDSGSLPAQEPRDLSVGELLRRIYALFHNKRFGLLLILAMAVLTLLGVLFPQAPQGVLDDPAVRDQWLETMRPRFGGWTSPLAFAGLFGVFSSWPFRIVTGLLALSIIACTTHRLPQLMGAAFHPHVRVRPTFFDHARLSVDSTLPGGRDAATDKVRAELLKDRYRVIDDADGVPLYADRNRLAPFGTVIAHLAFVVILAGVLVTSTFGLRVDDLSVPVGSRVEVGHGTGLAVEARDFRDSYHADGAPADYVSDLVLFHDGVQVAEQPEVRVNAPLRWGGYSVNQASFGIAADLTVTDPSGATVHSGGIPLGFRTEDEQYSYGRVELPAQGLTVYVITPASGQVVADIPAGRAQIEVYQAADRTPVWTTLATPGEPTDGAGLTWTFDRERQYTGLMVSRDPGAPIVWIGAALLAIGTCWTMFVRHHRLWLRFESGADGTRVRLASPDRQDQAYARSVHALVDRLTERPNDHHQNPEGVRRHA
ncbi:MAG: cytochrome c biogenesis protein ResB [Propionibacteriaceae bacterium]|nr:cytochrome c biogenesis protein ResB [Propionibacteriaceae bacterium]